MQRKKSLKTLRSLAGLIAAATLAKGCVSSTYVPPKQFKQTFQKLIVDAAPDENAELMHIVADYSEKSPTACHFLDEFVACAPKISFKSTAPDDDGVVNAGEGDDEELVLNSDPDVRAAKPLEATFFHEAEHSVHLKTAHEHGVNTLSFASLDDVFCYNALIEALAERKAAICMAEYERYPMTAKDRREVAELGKQVFLHNLTATNRPESVQASYVGQAMMLANGETNALPNQIYFNKNPNWNEIASLLSRGEVTEMPILPVPTLSFMNLCLLREIQKNPDVKSLNEMDLSCTLKNRSALLRDESAIKRMVSDMLFELVGDVEKSGHRMSRETICDFLYQMGFPTAEQDAQIKAGETTFEEVRERNLSAFTKEEMFDGALALISRPEIQACDTFSTQYFGKILSFSKQILCSPSTKRTHTQTHVR